MTSSLCDEKTRAIIHCDLLRASWLNLKNSKEKLEQLLKSKINEHLNSTIDIFNKDFDDANLIQEETNAILREMDIEMKEINDKLRDNNAPQSVIISDFIKPKFNWMYDMLVADLGRLKQCKEDGEDRLTALQNENLQIHNEFKAYVNRTQLEQESRENLNNRFLIMNTKIEEYETELTDSQYTIYQLNEENLELRNKLESMDIQIKGLQNGVDESSQINNELQYKLDVARERNIEEKKSLENPEKECHSMGRTLMEIDIKEIPSKKNLKHTEINNEKSQIDKLLYDLAALSDRYSEKRERHRKKLSDARYTYEQRIQELTDNENIHKTTIRNMGEELETTHLRLKKITEEKNTMLANILKLENESENSKNKITLYQEKILQLEKQFNWVKSEFLEKPDVIPN